MKVLFNEMLTRVGTLAQAAAPLNETPEQAKERLANAPAVNEPSVLGSVFNMYLIGAIIMLLIGAGAFFYSRSKAGTAEEGMPKTIAVICIAIGLVLVFVNIYVTYLS